MAKSMATDSSYILGVERKNRNRIVGRHPLLALFGHYVVKVKMRKRSRALDIAIFVAVLSTRRFLTLHRSTSSRFVSFRLVSSSFNAMRRVASRIAEETGCFQVRRVIQLVPSGAQVYGKIIKREALSSPFPIFFIFLYTSVS